jgi:hypothetical protein
MIVTYVLSHLILLLLHMHATAFPEQKVCSRLCFRFLQCFLFVFLLCFFFPSLPATGDPSLDRSTCRPPSFALYGFFFFLCACYFSGVLNYGTWEKSVESVTVGGLDIVENHGLHGVGLATL